MMKTKTVNILITGAGGFVGRNLAEYFQGIPCYTVYAANHSMLDLMNETQVQNFITEHRIDTIIHCANVGGSRRTVGMMGVVESNLRMFFNLVRCLTPKMRMIHCGSGAEYDKNHYQPKMSEDFFDKYVPADDYGYAKYVMSKYIEQVNNITCIRIFGLYGKYEDYRFKFISNAIVKNLLGLPIVINQNVVFDYLYINDFCKVIEQFVKTRPANKVMNITPSESIDLVRIANFINQVSTKPPSEIVVLNEGLNREYSGKNSRLLTELKEFSFTEYKAGIADLYRYYENALPLLDIAAVREDPYLKLCQTLKK